MPADPRMPPLFTRAEALAAGFSRHQIAQRLRVGRWRALRRGVYAEQLRYAAWPAGDQHLLSLVATLLTRGPDDFASHLSAALAYGWALPLDGPGPPTITCSDLGTATRRTADLIVQVASLPDTQRRVVGIRAGGGQWELRATSRARTVADNLRHLSAPDGVALGDSALSQGHVQFEQVSRVLEQQATWPYVERGRSSLLLLDPRRQTWLESWSFVRLHRLGLPMPEPQVTVLDERGRFVGCVDGWLADEAVALEPDGQGKYFLGSGQLPADPDLAAEELLERARRTVMSEKVREDRLRDLGVQVARWGTAEITRHPSAVLARIQAARARGDASRFTGRTAYLPRPSWLLPRERRRAS